MTDNEIIKFLKIHSNNVCGTCKVTKTICCNSCIVEVQRQALDLINRLQAENERLTEQLKGWKTEVYKVAEAIKEFAERLKPKLSFYDEVYIDSVVKEMVGEDKTPSVENNFLYNRFMKKE